MARLLLIVIAMLLVAGCGQRQLRVNEPEGSDFFVLQNNEPVPLTAERDVLLLKPAPFTIVSRNQQLAITLKEPPDPFPFLAPGIDTAAEHRSPFYVWRAYPADRRADYLVIGADGHSLLTLDAGLRSVREGLYAFTVRELYEGGSRRVIPLAGRRRPLKAAVWIDKDRDLIIDDNELRLLELVFIAPQGAS